MENGLSIYEQLNPVNQEIDVVYTPGSSVNSYIYEITKDGGTYAKHEIKSNKAVNIKLGETGKYKIIITTSDINGNINKIESGIYNIDVDKPLFVVSDEITVGLDEIKEYKNLDDINKYIINKNVRVIDKDENLADKIVTDTDKVDFKKTGEYKITYTVSDKAGNIATKEVMLNIVEKTNPEFGLMQYGFILIGIVIIIALIKNRRSVMLEKRISKYSVNPREDTTLSILDKLIDNYHFIVKWLSKYVNKSAILQNYSKKYQKYVILYKKIYEDAIDLVANKILIGLIFILIAIFAKVIQYQSVNFYEMLIIFVIGFIVPNFIYFYKYKIYRKKLENDIFQAIIIMNNAFKSGRSITQAIMLVSEELDGQVALEFEKMALELSYGLGIDVVFKRLADRVNIDEVNYLTASLGIINRTGGNIIKVFSSIEKTMFNKKKLNLELKSLTGSSKIIVYVLFAVPLLFILFISLINPSYFEPFYTTTMGIIFMVLIGIMYIGYIICVKKIMKVRM